MLTPKEKSVTLFKQEQKPLLVAMNERSKCVQTCDAKMFHYWSNVIKELETLMKG